MYNTYIIVETRSEREIFMGNKTPPEDDYYNELVTYLENQPGFIKIPKKGKEKDIVINMNNVDEVIKVSEDEYKIVIDEKSTIVDKVSGEKIMAYISVRESINRIKGR